MSTRAVFDNRTAPFVGSPRRRRASPFKIAVVVAATSLAAACGGPSTSVAQLWSAPMPASLPPMRKIVVMATRMDEANRRALEDSFVAALSVHGVEGVPSYRLFPDRLPERAQAEAAVQSVGADGILSANFKGVQEKLTYVPGYAGGLWGGYYGWGYGYGYGYGYVDTDEFVNLETTLWDSRAADTVVWAALTNTKNPSTGQDFVRSVTAKVIPQLAEARLIPPASKPAK